MIDPYQRLLDALDDLDDVFAPLSVPLTVGGCTNCYAQADLFALWGPVERVPEDLIPHVAAEVPDHWDDFSSLYHRMTPRIVRLLAIGRLHVHHGLVASRLLAAGWRDWPPVEQAAFEKVWRAWWQSAPHQYPAADPIDLVLERSRWPGCKRHRPSSSAPACPGWPGVKRFCCCGRRLMRHPAEDHLDRG